jgi:hypothetical protein
LRPNAALEWPHKRRLNEQLMDGIGIEALVANASPARASASGTLRGGRRREEEATRPAAAVVAASVLPEAGQPAKPEATRRCPSQGGTGRHPPSACYSCTAGPHRITPPSNLSAVCVACAWRADKIASCSFRAFGQLHFCKYGTHAHLISTAADSSGCVCREL